MINFFQKQNKTEDSGVVLSGISRLAEKARYWRNDPKRGPSLTRLSMERDWLIKFKRESQYPQKLKEYISTCMDLFQEYSLLDPLIIEHIHQLKKGDGTNHSVSDSRNALSRLFDRLIPKNANQTNGNKVNLFRLGFLAKNIVNRATSIFERGFSATDAVKEIFTLRGMEASDELAKKLAKRSHHLKPYRRAIHIVAFILEETPRRINQALSYYACFSERKKSQTRIRDASHALTESLTPPSITPDHLPRI